MPSREHLPCEKLPDVAFPCRDPRYSQPVCLGAVAWQRKPMTTMEGVLADTLPACPYIEAVRKWWRLVTV